MINQKWRRKYAAEIRESAIKMVLVEGLSKKKAAERLDCSTETVRRWVNDYLKTTQPDQLLEKLDAVKDFKKIQKRAAHQEIEIEFLQKVISLLHVKVNMRYALIKQCIDTYPIDMMCRLLEVSRSGYYDALNRPEKPAKNKK